MRRQIIIRARALFPAVFLFAVLFGMFSCSDDDSSTVHILSLYKPTGIAYADQQSDTLGVLSTDSWKCTIDASWITPSSFSETLDKAEYLTYPFTISVNTDGSIRTAIFTLSAHGKTVRKTYVQVPWLNITVPNPIILRDDSIVTSLYDYEHLSELSAKFYFIEKETAFSDTMEFKLYAPTARVTVQDDWLSLRTEGAEESASTLDVTGNGAEVSLAVAGTANSSETRRIGTIVIETSNGITQNVYVAQDGTSE